MCPCRTFLKGTCTCNGKGEDNNVPIKFCSKILTNKQHPHVPAEEVLVALTPHLWLPCQQQLYMLETGVDDL